MEIIPSPRSSPLKPWRSGGGEVGVISSYDISENYLEEYN